MIPFEKLDEVWETWKEEKGKPPEFLHISQDRFEDLLAGGRVKYYSDGHPYYRVHTRIMIWPMTELNEAFEEEDGQLTRLRQGEVDLE
jgi:hypothetical protein